MRWHCNLCDEDETMFLANHFRLMHPDEYEQWSTPRLPAFDIIRYAHSAEDVICCWSHPTSDGEEFRDGDVSVVVYHTDDSSTRICLECFVSGPA